MEVRVIIKRALAILGIIIVVGYASFALSGFLRGPRIVLESPLSGFSTTTPLVTLVGTAIHSNNLTINGAVVPLDLKGNFRSQLILAPGYNIMTITAEDHYNRTVEKNLEINLLSNNIATSSPTNTGIVF